MVGGHTFRTLPNRGEYFLLDKAQGELVNKVVFQCPNQDGKGVLVAPTVTISPSVTVSHRQITRP